MNRREVLWSVVSVAALAACGDIGWAGESAEPRNVPLSRPDAVQISDERWREVLEAEEYRILRRAGTERAFTGDLWDKKGDGVYVCAGCGLPLFDSKTKFKSGTGWPSYYAPIAKDAVLDLSDVSLGMLRTETVCARCGGHLGHVFSDGPAPTGLRYCMNSASLDFVPRAEVPTLTGEVLLGGWSGPKAGAQ